MLVLANIIKYSYLVLTLLRLNLEFKINSETSSEVHTAVHACEFTSFFPAVSKIHLHFNNEQVFAKRHFAPLTRQQNAAKHSLTSNSRVCGNQLALMQTRCTKCE